MTLCKRWALWIFSSISPWTCSPLLFVSVLFHHLIPQLSPFFSCHLVSSVVCYGWCLASSVSASLFGQDKGSPLGCALLSSFMSFSSHYGGCHSSVLPNQQAERVRQRERKRRGGGGGGGRDLGTQDGNIREERQRTGIEKRLWGG